MCPPMSQTLVYFLLGISPASNYSWPTFRNPVSVPSSKAGCIVCHTVQWVTLYTQPLKMELIQGSETSANYNLTPGKYPEENIQYSNHGESLKSRITNTYNKLLSAPPISLQKAPTLFSYGVLECSARFRISKGYHIIHHLPTDLCDVHAACLMRGRKCFTNTTQMSLAKLRTADEAQCN